MSTKFLKAREEDSNMREALSKDLRREHFVLGFDKDMPNQSHYGKSMKEHQLSDFAGTRQEMQNLRKDLRREHYQLGTDKDPNKIYQTSAANAFPKYDNPERSKLSQDTKNDLRSCHFVLGYDQKGSISDYKRNYDQKNIDKEVYQDRKDQVVALRAHHKVFNDKDNYFSSLYNETTNKQYDPSLLKQGKSKKEISDQIVELRKTNLLMGTNQPGYASESMQEYSDKGYAKNNLLDVDLRSTNYILGTDKDIYRTTVRETFKGEFVPPDNGKTKELVKDLRQEHYSLGNDKANYLSENARTYKEFSKDEIGDKPDLSALYKSHFRLGGPSANISNEQRYTSDYKQTFQKQDRIENKSLRNDRTDRSSNICFGSEKNNEQFISEQQKNMLDFSKENDRGQLDKALAKDLRGTHYKFGTDKPEFISQNQETFTDKSKIVQQSALDAELKKDLRRNHFEYGTNPNEYGTMHQEIGKYQGPPSKLNPKLSKELRGHHFNHGMYGVDYNTTYKVNHIDFTKD